MNERSLKSAPAFRHKNGIPRQCKIGCGCKRSTNAFAEFSICLQGSFILCSQSKSRIWARCLMWPLTVCWDVWHRRTVLPYWAPSVSPCSPLQAAPFSEWGGSIAKEAWSPIRGYRVENTAAPHFHTPHQRWKSCKVAPNFVTAHSRQNIASTLPFILPVMAILDCLATTVAQTENVTTYAYLILSNGHAAL